MSSRILGKDHSQLAPIAWRQVPTPGGALLAHADADAVTPPAPDVMALESELARIEKESTAREARAREAGIQEGEARSRAQLEAPLQEALTRLAHEVRNMSAFARRLRREAEEDLVRLSIEIARRILRREILTDPEAILGLAKAALDRVEAREVIRVRTHPQDARTLETRFAELGMPERCEVSADPRLERGAVILETSRGMFDASVDTQLQEIERGFADLVRRRG